MNVFYPNQNKLKQNEIEPIINNNIQIDKTEITNLEQPDPDPETNKPTNNPTNKQENIKSPTKKPIPMNAVYNNIKFRYNEKTAYINEDLRDESTPSYMPQNMSYSDIYENKNELEMRLQNSELLFI